MKTYRRVYSRGREVILNRRQVAGKKREFTQELQQLDKIPHKYDFKSNLGNFLHGNCWKTGCSLFMIWWCHSYVAH